MLNYSQATTAPWVYSTKFNICSWITNLYYKFNDIKNFISFPQTQSAKIVMLHRGNVRTANVSPTTNYVMECKIALTVPMKVSAPVYQCTVQHMGFGVRTVPV